MLPTTRQKLRKLLVEHEGLKIKPYKDQKGLMTIGIGRCLDVRGISETEAFYLLDDDIMYFGEKLSSALPWFSNLDENRQVALIDMAFNVGLHGVLEFSQTLDAMEKGQWQLAAAHLLDSKAAEENPNRYQSLANIIISGQI